MKMSERIDLIETSLTNLIDWIDVSTVEASAKHYEKLDKILGQVILLKKDIKEVKSLLEEIYCNV